MTYTLKQLLRAVLTFVILTLSACGPQPSYSVLDVAKERFQKHQPSSDIYDVYCRPGTIPQACTAVSLDDIGQQWLLKTSCGLNYGSCDKVKAKLLPPSAPVPQQAGSYNGFGGGYPGAGELDIDIIMPVGHPYNSYNYRPAPVHRSTTIVNNTTTIQKPAAAKPKSNSSWMWGRSNFVTGSRAATSQTRTSGYKSSYTKTNGYKKKKGK